MCQPHWETLKTAIRDRGLYALVAESGEQAAKNLVAEVEDGPSIDNYDPLMAAYMAILNNTMGITGIEVMHPNADGSERCPLCFLTESHKAHCAVPECTIESYDHWIDKAADEQVEVWKSLGSG